jgi:hypothetical protein
LQSCSRWRVACASRSSISAGRRSTPLHAPEVECIGKGNAHRPYEFGVKVSVATTLTHGKGGEFVTDVKALPGNPYDGRTLATVIPDMEALVGNTIARILADKRYRGQRSWRCNQRSFVCEIVGEIGRQMRTASRLIPPNFCYFSLHFQLCA